MSMKCKQCNAEVHPLEVYSKGECFKCHSTRVDKEPMPTAKEVADAFKKAVVIN